MNIYAMYTIGENGEIGLIGKGIPNDTPTVFSAEFESSKDKTFYTHYWNNVVGERVQCTYQWDEEQSFLYPKANHERHESEMN